MKKRKKKTLDDNCIRVIKISREALFEFIYEKFIEDQNIYFDIDPLQVTDTFDIDWENGQFIFCVHKSEDDNENMIPLPDGIDLQQLMKVLPDTTSSMYSANRYQEYTKDELVELSKKQ